MAIDMDRLKSIGLGVGKKAKPAPKKKAPVEELVPEGEDDDGLDYTDEGDDEDLDDEESLSDDLEGEEIAGPESPVTPEQVACYRDFKAAFASDDDEAGALALLALLDADSPGA